MMRLAALLFMVSAAAACRDDGGPATVTRIRVLAGDQPDPGIRVYGHTPDGQVIAEAESDAIGVAELAVDASALVTVVFTGDRMRAITTTAPATDTTLDVHGPARPDPPLVVGTVHVDAPLLAGATYYEIDLGCVTVIRTQFPESIDVTACALGLDKSVDVLLRAFHDAGAERVFDGYAAAEAPVIDGIATVGVGGWKTTGPALPLTNTVANTELDVTYFVDTNAYAGPPVVNNAAFYYDEFQIDATYLQARRAMQTYELYGAGVPTVSISDGTFLPPITTAPSRDGSTYAWPRADAGDAELVALHVVTDSLTWETALPVETTSIAPPDALPVGDGAVTLEYIHATDREGVYTSSIVPTRAPNEIARTRIGP